MHYANNIYTEISLRIELTKQYIDTEHNREFRIR